MAGWSSASSASAGKRSSAICPPLLQGRWAFPRLQSVTDRTVAPPPVPHPVIIDSDPGIDDMLALFLALGSPELDVRGISVSYGNTAVENAYRNAVAIVRRTGKRTTLGVGARRPLARPLSVASETHGESGLGYPAVPPPGRRPAFLKALDRLLPDQPAPGTLVTPRPVTSLAP